MKKTLLSTIAMILTTTALSSPAFSQAVEDPQVDGFANGSNQASVILATKGGKMGGDDDGANHDVNDDHGDDGDDHDEGDDHGNHGADHDAGDDNGGHGADHDAGDDNGGEGDDD